VSQNFIDIYPLNIKIKIILNLTYGEVGNA
jgi:hypothetical protein